MLKKFLLNDRLKGLNFLLYVLFMYWATLAYIGVRVYAHNIFISNLEALAILVVIPAAFAAVTLVIICSGFRIIASYYLISTISVIIALWAFCFFVQIKKGSADKIERVIAERKIRTESYPSVVPQAFLNEDWANFIKTKGIKKGFIPLADIANAKSIYCKEAGDFLVY